MVDKQKYIQKFKEVCEFFMLSVERVKKILKDLEISDQEAEALRDAFRYLVEDIIFEKWQEENRK